MEFQPQVRPPFALMNESYNRTIVQPQNRLLKKKLIKSIDEKSFNSNKEGKIIEKLQTV